MQLVGPDLSKQVWLVLAVPWFIYMLLSSDLGNEYIMSTVWKVVVSIAEGSKKNPPEEPHC